MKHSIIRKITCILFAVLLVMQFVPFSSLAANSVEEQALENFKLNYHSEGTQNDPQNIISEVKEKRSEYKKEFLLEDGSYYSITSSIPIHKLVDGVWEDLNDEVNQIETLDTVDDVRSVIQSLETVDNSVSIANDFSEVQSVYELPDPLSKPVSGVTVTKINNVANRPAGRFSMNPSDSSILIKTNSIDSFCSLNQIVKNAKLYFNCSAMGDTTVEVTASAYEAPQNTNTVLFDSLIKLDYTTINGVGEYSLDITDLFNRWDLGVTENNGIILRAQGETNIVVSNFSMDVFYWDIDSQKIDSTYHTVDMGLAGTLYMNNYTHTIKLEQNVIDFNSKVSAIPVSRMYTGIFPDFFSEAGVGFSWNFESVIEVSDNICSWKMFDGTTRFFVPDDTVAIENGYQVWNEVGGSNTQNNIVINAYILDYEIQSDSIDYSNVLIKQGEKTYSFNSDGYVVRVERPGTEGTIKEIDISYDSSGRVSSLRDENGYQYEFSYLLNEDLYTEYLNEISVKNSDGELVETVDSNGLPTDLTITFETSYIEETETTESMVTYPNGFFVVYQYDYWGYLVRIKTSNNDVWTIDYLNEGYDFDPQTEGNKVTGYTKKIINGDNTETTEYSVKFRTPNGLYREIQKLQNGEIYKEIIQYNRDINIVTHKDFDGKVICAGYDENGNVSSYAFNENQEDVGVVNGDFETLSENGMVGWAFLAMETETDDQGSSVVESTWEENDAFGNPDNSHGQYEYKFSSTEPTHMFALQPIEGDFKADKTYVVGGWVKVNNTIPTAEREVRLEVQTESGEVAFYAPIDNSLYNEWQYKLMAFKLPRDTDYLSVVLMAYGQCGEIRFDNITVFEAVESQADLLDITTSSPISYEYNSDGTLKSETINNGELLINKTYSYENGKLSEVTDTNGLHTYYTYNGNSVGVGNIKDENGNISDITTLQYDSVGMLQAVNQTVRNAIANVDVDMSTVYTNNGSNITSVYHNGFEYVFEYNQNGTIKSIDRTSASYTKTDSEAKLLEYGYTPTGNVGLIRYNNDYEVTYTYNMKDKISLIECFHTDESGKKTKVKSYSYAYATNGDLSSIYDSKLGYTLVYEGNEVSLIKGTSTNGVEKYHRVLNSDGSTIETYNQLYFADENNTTSDIVTTSADIVTNTSNGTVVNTSTISIDKNSSNNNISDIDYSRKSVVDYFDRIISKSTVVSYAVGDNEGKVYNAAVDTNYEYKLLDTGVTSNLVSSYTTIIAGDRGENSSDFSEYSNYSRKYEYDDSGNIIFVYAVGDSGVIAKEFYEYDAANQLISELNFEKKIAVRYTYNSGGNLTAKIKYSFSTVVFDVASRTVTNWGTKIGQDTYAYNQIWKDQLESYNNIPIQYDSFGNPLSYTGINSSGQSVTGTMVWHGNKLVEFIGSDFRCEYEYDLNGNRTKKTNYSIDSNGNETFVYSLVYLWNGNVLTGILYKGGNSEEINFNLVYDQEGSPIGYVSMYGLPYFFEKDINGNVVGLVHADGSEISSISYDSWGLPEFGYRDLEEINFIQLAEDVITTSFCPIMYQGSIYDYETGMYFVNGRYYSPVWSRYLNPDEPSNLQNVEENVLSANLYLFNKNNTLRNYDPNTNRKGTGVGFGWSAYGFYVEMNDLFASRLFCMLFANQIIKEYGVWDAQNGYNLMGMNSLRIASDLFAHYIGKYDAAAVNQVNAIWGAGWMISNSSLNQIFVQSNDLNAWKYEKIWNAAPEIKAHSSNNEINITL